MAETVPTKKRIGHAKESRRASKVSSAFCQAARKRSASGLLDVDAFVRGQQALGEEALLQRRQTKVLATGSRTGPAPPGGRGCSIRS